MIEKDMWDIIHEILGYVWIPIGAVMTYVFKDYKAQKEKTIELEHRVVKLEIHQNDLKEDLKGIKEGVDKLIDHLLDIKK